MSIAYSKACFRPRKDVKILPFSTLKGELSARKSVEHFGGGRHRQAKGKEVPWRSLRTHRSGHSLLMSGIKERRYKCLVPIKFYQTLPVILEVSDFDKLR